MRQLECSNSSVHSLYNKNGILTAKKTQAYSPIAAKVSAKPSYIAANDIVLCGNERGGEDGEDKMKKSSKKDKKKKDKKRKVDQIDETVEE